MSRMSVSSRTREGMLLTAPGKTSHTPTVPTVSIAPVHLAADLKSENQLCRRGERILAARHQLSAGVPAFAFNHDAHAGRRGDVRHQTDVDPFLLEQRSLLDVQFDELMEAARGQAQRIRATP